MADHPYKKLEATIKLSGPGASVTYTVEGARADGKQLAEMGAYLGELAAPVFAARVAGDADKLKAELADKTKRLDKAMMELENLKKRLKAATR